MQYFESSLTGKRQDIPQTVKAGDSVSIELLQGEKVQAYSKSSDSTGELAIDSMGQCFGVQTIAIPGNGQAFLGPVPDRGRVIVRVTAKTGYIGVSVS